MEAGDTIQPDLILDFFFFKEMEKLGKAFWKVRMKQKELIL